MAVKGITLYLDGHYHSVPGRGHILEYYLNVPGAHVYFNYINIALLQYITETVVEFDNDV